jgi:hypothetical protein
MMRIIRYSLLAAATTALVACGSGPKLGGGKEGAAKAMFETSQASHNGLQRATRQAAMRAPELASRAASGGVGEMTLTCAKGGKLKLRIDFAALLRDNFESGKLAYEIEFDDCNEDGTNELNGELAIEFAVAAGTTSLELKFKGKVEINGEVDDFIDVDVTQVISAVGIGQTSGSVSITLTGTIETSEATYTYDGTPLSITVEGGLPVAEDGRKP